MHYSVTLLLMWVWSRWWWFSQCGCCPLKRSSRVDENSRSCTDVASYPAGRSFFFFFFLTPQTFPWERCWEQLSGKKWDETNKNDWPHYFWMMSPFLRDCWAIEAAEVFFNIFSKLFWWAKTQKQSFIHMLDFCSYIFGRRDGVGLWNFHSLTHCEH